MNNKFIEYDLNENVTKEGDVDDSAHQSTDSAVDVNGDSVISPDSSNLSAVKSSQREMEAKLLKQLTNIMLISSPESLSRSTATTTKKTLEDYKFWRTQPVPNIDEEPVSSGPIEPDKEPSDIRETPYSLPEGFYWSDVQLDDEDQLQEVYTLLHENYVEDDDHLFRFDYSKDFLLWVLKSPGWLKEWHVGLRVNKNHKLVGFIAAIPCKLQIYDALKRQVEINFLCVHKKLRSKRMAPVLIREITRRVHQNRMFQAVFTSGTVLPKPVATCRYWHRPLNPRKLIQCEFSHLNRNMTLQRTIKLHRLPDAFCVPGFRQMKDSDAPKACKLLNEYLRRFSLHPIFSLKEFVHWFIPQEDIVNSFVVENKAGEITDFCSYYVLSSSVIKSKQHSILRAAYSFYNVAGATSWVDLIRDMLIAAKKLNFDVFNALDLMENKKFLEELKFGTGDGNLYYYLYNWKCPSIEAELLGLVLQ